MSGPIRHVHLGLGNFFRAHQAYYTQHAPDGADWGIAAFSGRSAGLADRLTAQDCRYTLVTRGADGDAFALIDSVRAAHAATHNTAWLNYFRDPAVAVLTLTVTETGYRLGTDDEPTPAARLVAGLAARRAADAGPITVVSCDNLPANGAAMARAVHDLAERRDPSLGSWIADSVSYVDTVVDRITPRATSADVELVTRATGFADRAPVLTEPFTEWVLAGTFVAGHPAWGVAGARFVDDVRPFERRKLWLLNAAHSLLAYVGLARGHDTVAAAFADPVCRDLVEQWWDIAGPHLGQPADEVAAYRAALAERFANPRIRHLLVQIAADGSQKLPVRFLPVLRAERAAGRLPEPAVAVLAAWLAHLHAGTQVSDPRAAELLALASAADATRRVLAVLDPALADDADLRAAVAGLSG